MKYKILPIKSIIVRDNVRLEDDEGIGDLMQSIDRHGLKQPLVVKQVGYMYELICGNRRLKALKLLNEPFAPCMIEEEDVSETDKIVLQIVENCQRQAMSAFEYCEAFNRLKAKDQSLTRAKFGALIGRGVGWVNNQFEAIRVAGYLIEKGEDPASVRRLSAGQIIGRAQAAGVSSKGEKKQEDIEIERSGVVAIRVRCRTAEILNQVLSAVKKVKKDLKKKE